MSLASPSAPEGEAMVAELMRFLPDGLTPNGWAVGAGVNRAVWGDIRRHGNASRRTLEKLLDFAGSSLAEFEALRVTPIAKPVGDPTSSAARSSAVLSDGRRGWRGGPSETLPLLGAEATEALLLGAARVPTFRLSRTREGSIARPASIREMTGAYAFALPVGNMWPRFRQGQRLVVTPTVAPVLGDDVLVRIAESRAPARHVGFVAELVWKDAHAVRLRHFSPGVEYTLERSRIAGMERIVGAAI